MGYSDFHQGAVGYPFAQYDVLGNERHKAVCNLRAWMPETNYSTDGMGEIHIRILYQLLNLGGAMMMDGADAAKAVRDRLIHLLGGDQSHDSSPIRQENETRITDELLDLLRDARDEYKMLDRMSAETSANFHTMRDRVWGLEAERDELQGTIAEMQARIDELSKQNDMLRDKLDELSTSGATELYKLLKETLGDAKQVADKLNAHNGMLKESERLRSENAKRAADAINKACMYLDLLRDAARDYKALRDRLWHVAEVFQSYVESNA